MRNYSRVSVLTMHLHRAERMFDRLAALTHGLRVRIKALLHGFEQMLVLPSRDPPLRPRRALVFERAVLVGNSNSDILVV
jgi:hypothetical protein